MLEVDEVLDNSVFQLIFGLSVICLSAGLDFETESYYIIQSSRLATCNTLTPVS